MLDIIQRTEQARTKSKLEGVQTMINIDIWHNDKIKAVEKINIFFNDLTGKYWAHNCRKWRLQAPPLQQALYIQYSKTDFSKLGGATMRDLIELLKAFGLFISCLVIGYGGLFLFFY